MITYTHLLGIQEAARELGVSRVTVHRWIRYGLIKTQPRPTTLPGSKRWQHLIPRSEVERLKAGEAA